MYEVDYLLFAKSSISLGQTKLVIGNRYLITSNGIGSIVEERFVLNAR